MTEILKSQWQAGRWRAVTGSYSSLLLCLFQNCLTPTNVKNNIRLFGIVFVQTSLTLCRNLSKHDIISISFRRDRSPWSFDAIFDVCQFWSSKLPFTFPVSLVEVQLSLKVYFATWCFSFKLNHDTKLFVFVVVWFQTMLDLLSNNNFHFHVSEAKIAFPSFLHVLVCFCVVWLFVYCLLACVSRIIQDKNKAN